MALQAYVSAVQTLLHDPNAQFYPVTTLQGFINEARQQVALEGECIRGLGSVITSPGLNLYPNSTVTSPVAPTGIGFLITPRSISYNPQTAPPGTTRLVTLEKRNWEWFNFYWLGIAAPPPGQPRAWCPFQIGGTFLPQGQAGATGSLASGGSFYINTPSSVFTLVVDGTWSPINLANDNDPEALPAPWTDAVPWYASFLAKSDAQRVADAQKDLETYEVFMQRARGIVTPLAEQQAWPGGLAARTMPGQAPPTRGGR